MSNCVICRTGQRHPGQATRTLQRADVIVVIRGIPADVCDNCHEPYFEEDVVRELLTLFDAAIAAGVKTEVREFTAKVA